MLIFHIKSAPNGDGKRTEYVIFEHALLWMCNLPYRPGHAHVCVRGGQSASDESFTFVTDETVESILQRNL